MSGGALFMMVTGMIIIWGGLAASITYAVKVAKNKKATK